MKKFEYKIIPTEKLLTDEAYEYDPTGKITMENWLNELGNQGWQLAGNTQFVCMFMREIE